jgi:hypothetical protein
MGEGAVQTSDYKDLIELARICAKHAHKAQDRTVAARLWKMAESYQHQAAQMDGGKLADIGPKPSRLEF